LVGHTQLDVDASVLAFALALTFVTGSWRARPVRGTQTDVVTDMKSGDGPRRQ
jgi:hypothetical protein